MIRGKTITRLIDPSTGEVISPPVMPRHRAPLERPMVPYDLTTGQAKLRYYAQCLAAHGRWDDSRILRLEYLGYFVRMQPGQSEYATICSRLHHRLWYRHPAMHDGHWWDEDRGDDDWLPVLPWDTGPPRPALDREQTIYLYPAEPPRHTSELVPLVEARLVELGLPLPPWFDHACPMDTLRGSRRRADYTTTFRRCFIGAECAPWVED